MVRVLPLPLPPLLLTLRAAPGDSVRSVLSDLACCGLGYFLSAVFLSLQMIWLSGLWIAASEVERKDLVLYNVVMFNLFRCSAYCG